MIASPEHDKPIAVVVPNEGVLQKLASQNGIEGNNLEDFVSNKKMISVVLKELQSAGRGGGLASMEIIDGVVLAGEEWTPQNVSIANVRFF